MTTIADIALVGQYQLHGNQLKTPVGLVEKPTIYIRTRKVVKPKTTEQVLSINKPTSQYISNLYPQTVATGSTASGQPEIEVTRTYLFDDKNLHPLNPHIYRLVLRDTTASIDRLGRLTEASKNYMNKGAGNG